MDQQIHYACSGECNGVSPTPGKCQTPSCSRFGQPLEPCDCADGHHRVGATEPLQAPAT